MTNPELKVLLQRMLDEGNFDTSTISTLQDASIHVAMKLDLPLEGITIAYGLLAAGHEMMKTLLNIDMSKMEVMGGKQPDLPAGLAEMLGIKPEPEVQEPVEKLTAEERKMLDALLKDIRFD